MNIRHDFMLNEYPQEFVDPIMKPLTNNLPSSLTKYQGSIIIPDTKGICKKFRCTGNCFNVRTIFKTKHTLLGTLVKTGLVRDAQERKQHVCNIPCDCVRCYIGEKNRHLEVCIKEKKHNLTKGLFEKSKLAQHAYKEGHKMCWKEMKVF
jgi:hypothetical protein